MEYLYEKDFRDEFWNKNYKYKKNLLRYQFESHFRDGNIDLITLENVNDNYQICAFEFKLKDVKRALTQAEANIPFVHKSFVVIPIEKKQLVLDKYYDWLRRTKYVGVIGVHYGGRWEMIHKPQLHKEINLSEKHIRFLVGDLV